jgi:hypothetical protein
MKTVRQYSYYYEQNIWYNSSEMMDVDVEDDVYNDEHG